jgi:hypothetical protein
VSGLAKSIDALYFDYKPVPGHLEGCRLRGTDMWEVTRYAWESFDGSRCEETIRLACHECGVVHFRGSNARRFGHCWRCRGTGRVQRLGSRAVHRPRQLLRDRPVPRPRRPG